VTDLAFQRDHERFKVSYIIYIGSRKNNRFSYVPGILTKDGLVEAGKTQAQKIEQLLEN
jgi:hypothetical protein